MVRPYLVQKLRVPRTRFPSTMICARFPLLSRLLLTIVLEQSAGKLALKPETQVVAADNAVILAIMPSAHDVARYILEQMDELDTWKLQKLVYYSQAWHLAWDNEPMFDDPIEAWSNGPVVPVLFREHRGKFKMTRWPKGKISQLTKAQRKSIDVVLKHYGKWTGSELREKTHKEPPWRDARGDLAPGERSNHRITHDAMASYYGSL